jgi:regulator of protease activity HflC (stomatin/prohibitin superfamily)
MNPEGAVTFAQTLIAAGITFVALFVIEKVLLALMRMFGIYAIVQERVCRVYVLFGKVIGVLDEPGLYILPFKLGPAAFIANFMGTCYKLDMRLDQEYLRSQPVNSEEGAPMGIGVWYEMQISNPQAYLFQNTDPRGSLRANVSNATVRCLSNMPLGEMLETRHKMSQTVRAEVTEKSRAWGYESGSVYIRKVHFRDQAMIRQIEEKVVNRLRQVTSAIRQDGANQVSIITSSAEREAAVEFAKAAAIRPNMIGTALSEIAQNPEVAGALFDMLETNRLLESGARVTLLPSGHVPLSELLASGGDGAPAEAPRRGRGKAQPAQT